MKLRQCVFVCKDLEASREELCETLGIEVAYQGIGAYADAVQVMTPEPSSVVLAALAIAGLVAWSRRRAA